MFGIVRRVNDVYPIEFKVMTPRLVAWMDNGRRTEPGVRGASRGGRYDRYSGGRKGNRSGVDGLVSATESPPFKELAQNGASWIVITDLPVKIPGLDAWLRASGGIGRLASHGKTSGGRVSATGLYLLSRTRAYCVD